MSCEAGEMRRGEEIFQVGDPTRKMFEGRPPSHVLVCAMGARSCVCHGCQIMQEYLRSGPSQACSAPCQAPCEGNFHTLGRTPCTIHQSESMFPWLISAARWTYQLAFPGNAIMWTMSVARILPPQSFFALQPLSTPPRFDLIVELKPEIVNLFFASADTRTLGLFESWSRRRNLGQGGLLGSGRQWVSGRASIRAEAGPELLEEGLGAG